MGLVFSKSVLPSLNGDWLELKLLAGPCNGHECRGKVANPFKFGRGKRAGGVPLMGA